MKSEKLCIKVMEADQTRVALTFAAHVAENLPDLVPEEFRSKLERQDIDLRKIAKDAVSRNFEPGDLLQFIEGNKSVRIWLE